MNKLLVEFLGTFALVFVVLSTSNALVIGATLAAAILLGGAISGGAFNPAVTLGMFMNNSLSRNMVLPYMGVQLLAAFLAYHFFKNMKF